MARKPLAEAQWRVLRDEMRDVMVETARQGQLITYSELCAQLKTAYLHYHSPQIVRLLDEIGMAEREAGRPILPAVVVGKQSGIPGAGYFRLAGEGHDNDNAFDPEVNWEADLQAVFDYWSTH
ncbi:MAG: hypothetical protein ABI970_19035 [Chloroflexota bacterium]